MRFFRYISQRPQLLFLIGIVLLIALFSYTKFVYRFGRITIRFYESTFKIPYLEVLIFATILFIFFSIVYGVISKTAKIRYNPYFSLIHFLPTLAAFTIYFLFHYKMVEAARASFDIVDAYLNRPFNTTLGLIWASTLGKTAIVLFVLGTIMFPVTLFTGKKIKNEN